MRIGLDRAFRSLSARGSDGVGVGGVRPGGGLARSPRGPRAPRPEAPASPPAPKLGACKRVASILSHSFSVVDCLLISGSVRPCHTLHDSSESAPRAQGRIQGPGLVDSRGGRGNLTCPPGGGGNLNFETGERNIRFVAEAQN